MTLGRLLFGSIQGDRLQALTKPLAKQGILGDHLGLVLTPFGHQGRRSGPEHLWHGALLDERIRKCDVQDASWSRRLTSCAGGFGDSDSRICCA
jgi:hypothetical protein